MEEDAAPRPPLKGRRVSPSLHLSQSLKYRVGWGGGTEWAVGRFLPLLVAMPLRCVLCPHLSPQSKLVKYFSRQLSCKKKVALQERNAELDGFPQLRHWFRIVDVRKEVLEEITPGQLSLEDLLEMTDEQVCETVEKYGANREECARLNASLSCLRKVHMSVPSSLTLPCLSQTIKQKQANVTP
uniref:Kinase suppressor of RAS SAM-like domain-containing protein n=1 Tax=Equus caballus TaxID=9796 RepID=A0A9L0RL12_HORSE